MNVREPSSLRLVLTLGLAGMFAGVVLVGVYLGTLPAITRNRAEALRAAILDVLPGTETIETYVPRGATLEAYVDEALPEGPAVYAGVDASGALVGYAVPADGPGFMDTIRLIYGFDPGRNVIVGMAVLDSRETPGLGDKIIHDDAFLANFEALRIEPEIVPVKKGAKTRANEVDCITGATISSEAVVSILNRSAAEWAARLREHRREGGDDVAAAGRR